MNRRLSSGAVIAVAASLVLSACSGSSSSPSSNATTSGGAAAPTSGGAAPAPTSGGGAAPSSAKGSTAPSPAASTTAVGSNLIAEDLNNSGTPVKGGTLHMLGIGDIDYMDPNLMYYSASTTLARLFTRQLVTFPAEVGKTTTVVPDLATAPVVADSTGLVFKITIKTGAKWDTTPARQITAADEVRGIKRTCNPAQPFGGLPDFEPLIAGFQAFCDGFAKVDIKSAAAIADYQNKNDVAGLKVDPSNPNTIDITLTHPAAFFPSMLSMQAFSPAPVEYDKFIPGSPEIAQHMIADGPYKITKYNPAHTISLIRNPAWDASTDTVRKAYVDAVEINETGDQNAIQQQLQANTANADMEWDTFPPPNADAGLIAKKDPNFYLGATFSSNPFIVFNNLSPNETGALGKVAVRKALSEALSRDHLIQDLGGPAVNPPLTHVLPQGISGTASDTSIDLYKQDTAQAKKDLAAAGYPNGLTLKYLYRSKSVGSSKNFVTVQQDLKEAGIKIVGVPVPNADFYTKYLQKIETAKAGTWDLASPGWGPDWYGDAALSFFAPLFNGKASFPPNGSDWSYYDNPAVTAIIDQASKEPDATKASALWAQADKQVMEDAPFFPITTNNQGTYHASHVHNTIFIPAMQQVDPANVWLTKS